MYHIKILAFVTVFIMSGSTPAAAGKRDKPRETTRKEFKARPLAWGITGVFMGAYSTDMPDNDFVDYEFNDRVVYGLGASLDYYPHQVYALGLNIERTFKTIPDIDVKAIRATAWSGSFTYNFRTMKKLVPYGKICVGFAHLTWPLDEATRDLGTHTFFRISVGLLTQTGSFTNTRFEIFHNMISADVDSPWEHVIERYGGYFGIQVGINLPFHRKENNSCL